MTKKLLGAALAISLSLVSLSASADPPAPPPAGKVTVLKTIVVYGKRQLPSVVIEIARLSAAHEASEAHESLHAALVEQSVPAALRPQ